MRRQRKIKRLQDIPNIGPAMEGYLHTLGINKPDELAGKDPYHMYNKLCTITHKQMDPCVIDIFISAVKYMEGARPKKWWEYTQERKVCLNQRNIE